MAKCDPGGVAVESAEKLRGRRAAPHYAINAPLRARSGAAVEQDVEDVEDYRRSVELIANLVHAASGGTFVVSSKPPTTPQPLSCIGSHRHDLRFVPCSSTVAYPVALTRSCTW